MKRVLFPILLLILIILLANPISFRSVKAAPQGVTRLLILPTMTCCSSGSTGARLIVGSTFSVDVGLDLAAGETINGFDLRINYTNPHSFNRTGVVQAMNIRYSGNIFANYSSQVASSCIDGVAQLGSQCAADDTALGQLHFAEVVYGGTFSGPASGLLFSVTFQVTGVGSSIFYFDRDYVVNPKDPANPSAINPHYLQALAYSAGFGNSGVIAFFDYQTTNPALSPSILPTVPVRFNATGSLNSNNTSILITNYSWDFGDGARGSGVSPSPHSYNSPGTYLVRLNVTDSNGKTGSLVRPVVVHPMLGNLQLIVVDSSGTRFHGNINVQVFNTSSSPFPALNQTVAQSGIADIRNLVPGTYHLKFSGPGVVTGTKEETVTPGWTHQDIVALSLQPTPQDYTATIFLVSLVVVLGIFTTFLVLKKRKDARLAKAPGRVRKTRST